MLNNNMKSDMLKIKNIMRLGTIAIIQWYSQCTYFESNYDYQVIIKEPVEEFEEQLTCLGENTNKYMTVSIPIQKEVITVEKMEKKLQEQYPTDNLLIAQDLLQAHYQ